MTAGNRPFRQITDIPFLPVSFFKTHRVVHTGHLVHTIFESSSTSGSGISQHLVYDTELYHKSYSRGFELVYGPAGNYRLLCLLPGYMDREHSSLVYMCRGLVQRGMPGSGLFSRANSDFLEALKDSEATATPTLLLGVTHALLSLAEQWQGPILKHTLIMETGGMKGHGPERVRAEIHEILCTKLGVNHIHSEYGMTELLSQAYSKGNGIFRSPPWMQVLIQDATDPGTWLPAGKTGRICVVDLANVYSCSFIATDDLGKLHPNGSFEVLGRLDFSDVRGCNLMMG
ncbi:MAG: acyl transferase [Bacteroidetes bacterium]|nr:acyl transferase [Bacteroidota bacterium]